MPVGYALSCKTPQLYHISLTTGRNVEKYACRVCTILQNPSIVRQLSYYCPFDPIEQDVKKNRHAPILFHIINGTVFAYYDGTDPAYVYKGLQKKISNS